jgi:hypothetical protein
MRATPLRCPSCQIVITSRESALGVCPVCHESLDKPAPPPPAPPVAAAPANRPFPFAALAVAIIAIAAAAGIHFLVRPKTVEPPQKPAAAATPAPVAATTPENPPSKSADPVSVPEVATTPAPPQSIPPPPSPAPAGTPETTAAPPPFREFTEPPSIEIKRGTARLTPNADGSWTLSRLDSRTQVKLRGSTGTLRVLGVRGGSSLDASKLDAREVIIDGEIDGRSSVKLLAPHGRIEFRGRVSGQSQINVTAQDGTVIFGDPASRENRTIIEGACRLMIITRELNLAGTVTGGGTHVTVGFLPEGILKFRELAGSARLDYRRADASLPETVVEAGKVTGNAKLNRLN